jgi:uncharacterized protein (TIGR03118 family)
MKILQRNVLCALFVTLANGFFAETMLVADEQKEGFKVINLVSDMPGVAFNTDLNLINSWGLTFDTDGTLVVTDNGTALATMYTKAGIPISPPIELSDNPTGIERNPSPTSFMFLGFPAELIFVTENGRILAFNENVNPSQATLVVNSSAFGSVYKGLAIAQSGGQYFLYATDFHNRRVDVFDSNFDYKFSFNDLTVPSDFAPFNIRAINDQLYVTYAKQLAPDNHDDQAGPGNGFVDVFNTDGTFVKRLISHGALNSPWGLALVPENFGELSGKLLVGNFGNGIINIYNAKNGKFEGQLGNENGVITIEGLWALRFNDNVLFFASGPNAEADGLVGKIIPVKGSK